MTRRRSFIQQLRPTLAAAGAVVLTTLALSPTLTGGPWFGKSLLAIATVAVIGAVGRALSVPAWGVIAAQGVGLLLLLTLLFAGDAARFGILPDGDVITAFSDLARDGNVVIVEEIAPVTATAGIQFLVVGGVGLIAWIVDAIAVSGRRAALAGIPLLALYLVPATVLPNGVPWQFFLAAGVGWLMLLLEDGRVELTRWGKSISGGTDSKVHAVGGTGRRLGAAALAIAIIVPVILPSLDDGRFGGGSGDNQDGSGGDGSSSASATTVVTINPITDLQRNLTQQDDSPVLFYTTDAQTPQYLRIATLDQFDGTSWTLEEMAAGSDQQASSGLPDPPGLSEAIARSTVSYDITVGALDTPRLPLPYPVSKVDIAGDWRWDEQTFDVFNAEDAMAFGQKYTATALEITPTAAQLRAAPEIDPSVNNSLYQWLDIPNTVGGRLTPLAQTVTADATTEYDRALALQNWFRTDFTYSLDTVEGNATGALDDFLRDRSGYCEQFAATMALMARTLGIPSRVQVGFTPGEQADGTWVVTVHDAHAWPELWFEGVGWVRFEPTPGGGDGSAVPGYAPAPQGTTNPGKPRNEEQPKVVLRRGGGPVSPRGGRPPELQEVLRANRSGRGTGPGAAASDDQRGNGSTLLLWLVLVAAAGAAASAPKVASVTVRRARWAAADSQALAIGAAWADVLDAATDVDLHPRPTETPRDLAERLPARAGLHATRQRQLRQLASWVELVRYRGAVDTALTVSEIKQQAEDIRHDFYAAISPRDRRNATWWPTSGRIALANGWNIVADRTSDQWQRWTTRKPRQEVPTG